MEIKQSNPKAFQELDLRIKELQSKEAKVGYFENSKYPDGTPVAYVAAIQEMGSPARSIPPRPTMRPAQLETENQVRAIAAQGAQQILEGKNTAYNVMSLIGLAVQNQVSKNIATLVSPALSPLTLAIRKFKKLNPNVKMSGFLVGVIAKRLKEGKINTEGVSTKPLEDTGYMSTQISSVVEDATA